MEDVIRARWSANLHAITTQWPLRARFAVGHLFGLATQAIFLVTVWFLFAFLKGPITASPGSLWWDVLLATQFALPPSWLLMPSTRTK